MIVKVQISLCSSDNRQHALIYSKGKKNMYQTDVTKEVEQIKILLGDKLKAYFKAKLVDTKYDIGKEVKTQDW